MDDLADAGIYSFESSFLDRYVQVGIASGRVVSVSFPDQPDPNAVEGDHPILERIDEYLEGVSEVAFDDVELALTVPTDQRAVLEQVRAIPYGESVGVQSIARMTPGLDPDDDDDAILIRTTLDENPIPIVIPDHRVRDGPSAAPPPVEQKLRSLEEL
ncbi:MGMT family protein [Natronosalvus vescus]|uniref:MGMT family protein n=1 Tax=Natronosalvus vescus TaxID=2953881 RepID=UPI002090A594|nr:MGMT family protein [Natronosalvus vescus]